MNAKWLTNQQLFTETYLLEEVPLLPNAMEACRQTIREWREEYPNLTSRPDRCAYVERCLSTLGLAYEGYENPDHFVLYGDDEHTHPLGLCLVSGESQVGCTTKGHHDHARLIEMLSQHKLAWGIVCNGSAWRLCYARSSAPYEVYLQADLDALLAPTRRHDFLLFYRFFNREAFDFVAGPDLSRPIQGLDQMLAESEKRTQVIERHLKSRVDGVLQALCLGFVNDGASPSYDREKLDEIYSNAIYLLYRILFLFYAEARALLPIDCAEYRAVSLESLIERTYQRQVQGIADSDRFSLWKNLTELFVIVDDGREALGVRAYNGGLFSDTDHPYLRDHHVADEYLSPALFDLAYMSGKGIPELLPQSIDYRDLSVRHLGTLYEGLLEYKLNIVDAEPVVLRESSGKRIYVPQSAAGSIRRDETILKIGEVYFADDKGERKASGSYYTPEDVVQYIVSQSVLPRLADERADLDATLESLLREREIAVTPDECSRIEAYIDRQTLDFIDQRILRLRVLDPAMGSGHFLVAAGQAITNFIVETLNGTSWTNETIDCDPLIWKRRVVEHCLYGVDLNPLAVELAKLALWISSASEGKPLTFLNHHLKTGNSLYGAPLDRLETLPTARQRHDDPLFRQLREAVIASVLLDLAEIVLTDSDSIGAVKYKEDILKQATAKATRLRDIANVWLASLFGLANADGEPLTEAKYAQLHSELTTGYAPETWESYVEADFALRQARAIAYENSFFHWEIEFADAVVDGSCRFDVVVANPPYVGMSANIAINKLYRTTKCNDLYAWLVEKAVCILARSGTIGTIVPLSLVFSRSFASLRELLLANHLHLELSCYDNIPDTLFNSGKTSENTNKENSQRVTIIIAKAIPGTTVIEATDLLRWRHTDRHFLFQAMSFADATDLCSSSSFPRIGNSSLAEFWRRLLAVSSHTIADLSVKIFSETQRPARDDIFLTIPRATRYFISATRGPMARNKVLTVSFKTKTEMDLARVLLNSNVFFWYWRAFGDGFLLNVELVGNFPVPDNPDQRYVDLASCLDAVLDECTTYKAFRGERIPNFNFNKRMDILLTIDEWIIRQVAPDLSLPRDIFAQYKSNSFLRPLDLSAVAGNDYMEANE